MGNNLGNIPAFKLIVIFLLSVDTHTSRRDKTLRQETHLLKTIYSSEKQTSEVTNIIEFFRFNTFLKTRNYAT